MVELSIVIPAHNEAGNIGALVMEIADVMPRALNAPTYEILVIDDGSTDATLSEAKAAMDKAPVLRVLRHANRAGKSAALKTGFDAARGRWIAMLDGDGQNDPADLAALWPELKFAPATVIYAGVRKRRNDGFVKWLTSRVANPIRRRMLRDSARDTGCGFKVIPASLASAIPYFDNMHRFFPALALRHGCEVREVMVNDRPRVHGVSKYGFFNRLAVSVLDVVGVYWLIRRYSERGEIAEIAQAPDAQRAAARVLL